MRKKRNMYFVNTVNIENTVNTANNKNNILIYLTLPMDRSLPVNTRDENVDEASRNGYVDYSERSFTDLCILITTTKLMNTEHSSCSDSESELELVKLRLTRCLRKR